MLKTWRKKLPTGCREASSLWVLPWSKWALQCPTKKMICECLGWKREPQRKQSPSISKWNLQGKSNSEWAVFDSWYRWKNTWITKARWMAKQASLSTSYISPFLSKMLTAVNDNTRSQHTECLEDPLKIPWNRDPTLLIASWLNPRVWFCFWNTAFLAV